jgi:hypothetical protein
VHLEVSTKPHVDQKFEVFWINIESAMGYPNSKNRPKKGLRPLGVKTCYSIESSQSLKAKKFLQVEIQMVDVKKMTC